MSGSGRLPPGLAQRRAVALAGHTGDEATARSGLHDPDGAVRATAIGALARLGSLTGDDLRAALADPDPAVRRRAVETTPGALDAATARSFLRPLLHDEDLAVVEVAAWACGEVSQSDPETVRELCRVAADHADALAREAAVAALGAVGDEAGLTTILAAMRDKPAIRRRAVLALAPFDGPEVDAALERATSDRDWQVRQAAEELRR